MSKNTNLSFLTDYITADITNGRIGINTPSPTVAFDVTGVAKFSSSVSATSFNATTQNIFAVDGTERMRITSAGKVGIGTTSPNELLDVNGAIQVRSGSVGYATTQSNGIIDFNAGHTRILSFGADTLTKGGIQFYQAGQNNTSGNFAMTITPVGNILINTSTDSAATWKLQVNSLIATLGTDAALVYQNRSDSTRYTFYATGGFSYFFNGGNIAQINMSNGVYTPLSDRNKKKDFEQSNIGLNEVLQLKPTLYRMKIEDGLSAKELGFIAQEVKEFIPQAYVETEGFIGLSDRPIIAALVKAVQELKIEIDTLKNK